MRGTSADLLPSFYLFPRGIRKPARSLKAV
jgi:hypothetical protein